MKKENTSSKNGYNSLVLLCVVFTLITCYNFYEQFDYLKMLVLHTNTWDLFSILSIIALPLDLVLIYFLYRGNKIAWTLFVISATFITLNAADGLITEWLLPAPDYDDSPLGQLLELMDPRMGTLHFVTQIIIYGALTMQAMRKDIQDYFSVQKKLRIVAIVIPILLAFVNSFIQ